MRGHVFIPAAAVAAALTLAPAAFAQHGHGGSMQHGDTPKSESMPGHSHEQTMRHGGEAVMTAGHHFEVCFTGDHARLYVYDAEQVPVPAVKQGTTAHMTLMGEKGEPQEMEMTWVHPEPGKGRTQGYFMSEGKFGAMDHDSMKVHFRITGMEDSPVEFETPMMMSGQVSYACPMNCVPPAEDPMPCPKCGMQMVPEADGKDGDTHHGTHDHSGGR